MLEEAIERQARLFWLGLGEERGERLEFLVAMTAAMARTRGRGELCLPTNDEEGAQAGAARRRGRLAVSLWEGPGRPTVEAVAREMGISKSSAYRYLRSAAEAGALSRPLREYKAAERDAVHG